MLMCKRLANLPHSKDLKEGKFEVFECLLQVVFSFVPVLNLVPSLKVSLNT